MTKKRLPALIESHQADAFTDLSLRDPKALRQMLLAETNLLKTQLAQGQKDFRDELDQIKKEAQGAKDARLAEHAREWLQGLAAIRRGLYRAEIGRTPDRELMNEWHEWERLGSVAGASALKQRLKFERQEMVRSELAIRGVRLPGRVVKEIVVSQPDAVETTKEKLQVIEDTVAVEAPEDWLAVWTQERQAWADEEEQYWSDTVTLIKLEDLEPAVAADLLRLKRRAHAEKRLSDRVRR